MLHVHGLKDSLHCKMAILPKLTCKFNVIPIFKKNYFYRSWQVGTTKTNVKMQELDDEKEFRKKLIIFIMDLAL